MAAPDITRAIHVLQRPTDLTLHKLSSPFLAPDNEHPADTRTPSSLAADLKSHKDLFARLRFSYTKQVEKERTLDCLVNQRAPEQVSVADLDELAALTATDKQTLQASKQRVEHLLADLDVLARSVAARHDALQSNIALLSSQPDTLAHLEQRALDLQAALPLPSHDPDMNLSAADTAQILADRQRRLDELDAQIARLNDAEIPASRERVRELETEVESLSTQETNAVARADEMRCQRALQGSSSDELQLKARWLRAKELSMTAML